MFTLQINLHISVDKHISTCCFLYFWYCLFYIPWLWVNSTLLMLLNIPITNHTCRHVQQHPTWPRSLIGSYIWTEIRQQMDLSESRILIIWQVLSFSRGHEGPGGKALLILNLYGFLVRFKLYIRQVLPLVWRGIARPSCCLYHVHNVKEIHVQTHVRTVHIETQATNTFYLKVAANPRLPVSDCL